MTTWKPICLTILLFLAIPVLSQSENSNAASGQKPPPPARSKTVHDQQQRDGNQVFIENCSRCHDAPDVFSSHITGTVIRHMRVRAGLSQQDEQALLRFLNP